MSLKKFLLYLLINLNLIVSQNKQISVGNVKFIGNNNLSNKALLKQVELKTSSLFRFSDIDFDRRLLKLDAISIKNLYNSYGFLEATVKDSFKIVDQSADIFFIVNEGKQYFLNAIEINGNKALSNKEILSTLGLNKGEYYNPIKINKNLTLLDEKLQNKGKLYAEFDVQQSISDSVNLSISISEGKDVYINNTWITGNNRVDTLIIRKEIDYRKGDLFKKSLIEKTKKNIYELNILSSLSIITHSLSNTDSLINLEIRIREYENRGVQNFDIGSYDIEYVPGISSMIGFGGSVNWTERMIFNTKNKFDAKGAVVMPTEEGFVYPRFSFDVKISNQRPLSFRLPIQLELFYQQFKNYGDEQGPYVKRLGLQYSNVFRWNQNRSFFDVGLRFELFDESSSLFQNEIEQRKIKLNLTIDKRNNPLYPNSGVFFQFKLDGYGGVLGGERSFSKFETDLRVYSNILNTVNVAGRLNLGEIFNWDEDYDQYESILFEKFYLGGSNTLRAYKPLKFEQDTISTGVGSDDTLILPFGNTAKLLTNLEIRFPLSEKFGLVVFYDGGLISQDLSIVTLDNIFWNRGIGLTYNSPFGPLRIDYGESINDKNLNQLHFGLGYSF